MTRAEFQKKLLAEKLERQRILLKRESISREAFDQLQTDYNMLEADIELLKVKISRTEIRAPFDGVMGSGMSVKVVMCSQLTNCPDRRPTLP